MSNSFLTLVSETDEGSWSHHGNGQLSMLARDTTIKSRKAG